MHGTLVNDGVHAFVSSPSQVQDGEPSDDLSLVAGFFEEDGVNETEPELKATPHSAIRVEASFMNPELEVEPPIITFVPVVVKGEFDQDGIAHITNRSIPIKVDNRGKHQALKASAGLLHKISDGNKLWARVREEMERGFDRAALPWSFKDQHHTGNAGKVLFMELLRNREAGVALVKEGEGFFGIAEVVVPADRRAAFDAGAIPSASSQDSTGKKRFSKIWRTAGFREGRTAGGGLRFVFDHEIFRKQREQQAGKSRRPPA